MEKVKLSNLSLQLEDILLKEGYARGTIRAYKKTWEELSGYMDKHGLAYYSADVGQGFLEELHTTCNYDDLNDYQKGQVRHISLLTDLFLYGRVQLGEKRKKNVVFEGEVGSLFRDFVKEEKERIAESTICYYKNLIYHFYLYLKEEGKTAKDITPPLVISFIKMIETKKGLPFAKAISTAMRAFLKYLCSHKWLQNNNTETWMALLKYKQVNNPILPSVYTREEIENVIAVIDRSTSKGKRDYALLLLASRTGLRASDIVGLRFCNLRWESNTIAIIQQKTGRRVTLPLSEEVGSAIIEYIKHARPVVDLPYVFITAHAPYIGMSPHSLYRCVSQYMNLAGFDRKCRKSGPHTMRHSLAVELLEGGTPLPVITGVLGHKTQESTLAYTRVSIEMLRKCALEVPFVPSLFYENLYE